MNPNRGNCLKHLRLSFKESNSQLQRKQNLKKRLESKNKLKNERKKESFNQQQLLESIHRCKKIAIQSKPYSNNKQGITIHLRHLSQIQSLKSLRALTIRINQRYRIIIPSLRRIIQLFLQSKFQKNVDHLPKLKVKVL